MGYNALPNVFPELHTCSLNGRILVVRNTFVDIADVPAFVRTHQRCVSEPGSSSHRSPAQSVAEEPLVEVRRREYERCMERRESRSSSGSFDGTCTTPDRREVMSLCEQECRTPSKQGEASTPASNDPPATPTGASEASSKPTSSTRESSPADPDLLTEAQETATEDDTAGRTTLMLRNLPEGFTRLMLEELFDREGFAARYDFVYLPADIASGASFGYAFVNLATPEDSRRFCDHFEGFQRWPTASPKRAAVHWSEALQGQHQQIERYRNSPLMHPSVPDNLRPAIYKDGRRADFPPPTGAVRPPRVRPSASKRKASEN